MVRQEGLGGLRGVDGEEMLGNAWEAAQKRCKALRKILAEAAR
jgi:hypothetical protein